MTCLVVEDDALIRLDLVETMSGMGYRCFEAGSVRDAEYIMKTQQFDVALLDLRVTDGTTLPVAEYLSMLHEKTAIIMITGTGAFPNGETAQVAPCVDFFLRKPVSMSDLSAIVEYTTKPSRQNETQFSWARD